MGVRKREIGSAVTNVICFVVVMVLAIVLAVKPLSPMHRGFFCDDVNIRYPYSKDTISVSVLGLTCLFPALLLAVGVELAYGLLLLTDTTAVTGYTVETPTEGTESPRRARVKTALGKAGILVACIIHGNGICFVLTEVFKLSFGRLRPYFLSACQPDADVTSFSNCSGLYIEEITCLNSDADILLDIRKSFVSGHASFAAFNVLFVCLYLQLRLPTATPRLLVSVLQGVALGYGVYVCGTRIYDHAHHPQDLLGGVCLAVLYMQNVSRLCTTPSPSS
ncbi:phospholipid phosphatase 3-like isoform X2 [Babylonia areolata]|uniref:phospholipid phosphatase 3-like isoform X2 n=1 Tax=Babylonia areolata TaxID=304850 RepID=UPI003FD34CD4